MDNFNWGVRRPSLSRLEDTEETGEASSSSALNSLSDVTPVMPKRDSHSGVGAEESSDDEMGSVRAALNFSIPCFLLTSLNLANIRSKSRGQQWSFVLHFHDLFSDLSPEFHGAQKIFHSSIRH